MLQEYWNNFAFEKDRDGGYLIRWHRCNGYFGLLSVTDLMTLRDVIEYTFHEYEALGLDTDEDVAILDQERAANYEDYCNSIPPIPALAKEKPSDHLYIIRDLDFQALKIGRSRKPESRLKALSTSAANRMELVKVYPEMGRYEEKVHNTLKAAGLHIRSEWFVDSPQVFEMVENFLKA